MKVKYLIARAGKGVIINPGDVGTVSTDKGKRLIAQGFAEEVKANPRKKVEVITTDVSKSSKKSKKTSKKN